MATVDDHVTAKGGYSGRSGREYARAIRHSRRVRLAKILFPSLSLIVIVALFAVTWLARTIPDGLEIERTTLSNGTIVMESPVLTGQIDENGSFRVNARQALQNISTPNIIRLNEITGELPLGSGGERANIAAEGGILNRTRETLELDRPFTIQSSNGVDVEMDGATFDLGAGSMVSRTPISITTGQTGLVAGSVRMRDNGGVIIFEDGVRMTIDPSTLRNNDNGNGE